MATTFYHSTSGGRTAAVREVWPRAASVPYLVSVADPHDRISKHHRWGPLRLTPADVARATRIKGVLDVRIERTASGRVAGVALKLKGATRRIEAQDFRRDLGLRSTWFNVRVLNLDPPLRRALADTEIELRGFVRGLRKVRLEQQIGGGTWTTVRPVRTRPDGRFTIVVEPKRTTSYRLASPDAAGGAITVRPR